MLWHSPDPPCLSHALTFPMRSMQYPQALAREAWMLDEYDECAGNIWRDWDSSKQEDSSNFTDLEAGDPPVLSWGFYLPQIRAWTKRAGLKRSQLLVMDFDELIKEGALDSVTDFMGLPRLADPTLPHKNAAGECADMRCGKVPRFHLALATHKQPGIMPPVRATTQVDVMSCKTYDVIKTVYAEWNEVLVRGLARDQEKGLAPPQEPPFNGFTSQVQCANEEVYTDGTINRAANAPSLHRNALK